jgi:hypothetical protein
VWGVGLGGGALIPVERGREEGVRKERGKEGGGRRRINMCIIEQLSVSLTSTTPTPAHQTTAAIQYLSLKAALSNPVPWQPEYAGKLRGNHTCIFTL